MAVPGNPTLSYSLPVAPVGVANAPQVVADVPFTLTVNMNTNGQELISYNLYVTSDDSRAVLDTPHRGILFPNNLLSSDSGSIDSNHQYRYQVIPLVGYTASNHAVESLFTLNTKIPGVAQTNLQLKRDGATVHRDNVITPQAAGTTVTIGDTPLSVTPALSRCGDGIVGYVDTNNNGVRDTGEVQEACDDGNNVGSTLSDNYVVSRDGCSTDCLVVDLGWDCAQKGFGDRITTGAACSRISSHEFFISKISSLARGECYPNCNHPAAMYATQAKQAVFTHDGNGKLPPDKRIPFIVEVGRALQEFLRDSIAAS